MTKLIGIKDLQKNTKKIREEVAKGVTFVVIYRSKPVFEIKPFNNNIDFVADMKKTNLYTDEFINNMKEAQNDIKKGRVKEYTADEFLNSLE
ncbi:MAG: hypothetical protein UR27_C0024G0006 [Candidatus Peregrinibacteria bacterium GW2011_GWA2_33_10]|nr:MAG: hypothetical protein UR27_C0024G0006 [Candidatus Peregrinibacteria bacterium GW2011_GWA2_33_10]KKP38298.1 MAG: hypothetical protein UR30_C0021G0006 [Candidatus Peregrinibacteria bacterium GW2011_GWC2_33_13]